MSSVLSALGWFEQHRTRITYLLESMSRAYSRTLPNQVLCVQVSTTAVKVAGTQLQRLWGKVVYVRAVTADVEICRNELGWDSQNNVQRGYLLSAGAKSEEFYVRAGLQELHVLGSASGVLVIAWSDGDESPPVTARYGA